MKAQEIMRILEEKDNCYAEYYIGIAEPSYDDKEAIAANWNNAEKLAKLVEDAEGIEILWSDEWTSCSHCAKAIRTQPDSYGWTPYYMILDGCEYVCLSCLDENWDDWKDEVLAEIIYHADGSQQIAPFKAIMPQLIGKLPDLGFACLDEESNAICKLYETGWHEHQTDHPAEILKELHQNKMLSGCEVIFAINSVGQFDVRWNVWIAHRGEGVNS